MKKKPKQPPELFDAADEPKRQRLRELGWMRVGGLWMKKTDGGNVGLLTEEEAFAWLEMEERRCSGN